MRLPDQTWVAEYSASRRKHHHRCRVCNRIVRDGESVVMLRQDRGTLALHVEPCSEQPHSPGVSWAEAFRLWGVHRNARLGFKEAKAEVDAHPFFRVNAMKSEAA